MGKEGYQGTPFRASKKKMIKEGFIKTKKNKKKKNQKKKKKKRRKKKSSPHFVTFPNSILIFHLPYLDFPSFLLHFPFFLASLFPIDQQKFPRSEVSVGHSAPLPAAC